MGHETTNFPPINYQDFPMFSPAIFTNEQYTMDELLVDLEPDLNLPEDADPSITTGMETAHRGLEVNASLPLPVGDMETISHVGDDQPKFGLLKVNNGMDPYFVGDVDPSKTSDEEIMHRLSAAYDHLKKQEWKLDPLRVNADLTKRDPWDVPAAQRCYIAKWGSDRKTSQGCWKEKGNEFTGIRANPLLSGLVTWRYAGFKRTLEFYMNDGSKTNWVMHEYMSFSVWDARHLCIGEEIVFHKILKNDEDEVSYISRDTPNDGEPEGKLNRNDTVVHSDQVLPGKRPRTDDPKICVGESDVWQHFTKIHVKVPKEAGSKKKDSYKLAYAVCHHCDKMLKAASKNGTSHLRRHAESCQCKNS